jgi:NADH-quinone oxidoreductase subunit J
MDLPVPTQMFFSYLLLGGLLMGIICLVLLAIPRRLKARKTLIITALAGFAAFFVSTLVLTHPQFRFYIFFFWLFTAAVVGGGIGTVTMRNVFHGALMLILSLTGVAGYFILVNAEFLAMVQVIIYIGGIMVLFLFGIMVSQNIIGTPVRQNTRHSWWALAAAMTLFLMMFFSAIFMSIPPNYEAPQDVLGNNTMNMGWSLMATYALPFEVASVLLLMAMLGAIILVRKD